MARIRAFELAAEELSIGGVAVLGQQINERAKVLRREAGAIKRNAL